MTAAHTRITLSQVALLTPDELRDYRTICRTFIRSNPRNNWHYRREVELLFSINKQLDGYGDAELEVA